MPEKKRKYLLALAVLAVTLLLRLPAFWTPILDVDESQFAGYAKAMMESGLPFLASVDTKPLGIYYFFAAIFSIFGKNNMIAVHVVTALWVWGTALFCYKIARMTYSERAGWIAAFFYAIFTTTYVPKFISTSIVVILMLPLTISIYNIICWEKDRRYYHLALSGVLFGIASLFKYQAGINIFLVALYFLLFAPLYMRRDSTRPKLKPFVVFTLGGVSIFFLFFLYLKSSGMWNAFVFWSIKGSADYIDSGAVASNFAKRLLVRGGTFMLSGALLWYFGIREIISLIHRMYSVERNARSPDRYLTLIWFTVSIVPVCTGGRFFGHYFIQLLPALCIMAGGSIARLIKRALANGRSLRKLYAVLLIGTIIPATGFFAARVYADEIYKAIGEDNPENYRPFGEYIQSWTKPDDKIFVWGFATPIYYFSDRSAASRFLWCDWLTGRIAGSPTAKDPDFDTSNYINLRAWDMLFEDLEASKPVYFVDTSPGNYHDYGKYPISLYPKLTEWLKKNYTLEDKLNGVDFYRRKRGK